MLLRIELKGIYSRFLWGPVPFPFQNLYEHSVLLAGIFGICLWRTFGWLVHYILCFSDILITNLIETRQDQHLRWFE